MDHDVSKFCLMHGDFRRFFSVAWLRRLMLGNVNGNNAEHNNNDYFLLLQSFVRTSSNFCSIFQVRNKFCIAPYSSFVDVLIQITEYLRLYRLDECLDERLRLDEDNCVLQHYWTSKRVSHEQLQDGGSGMAWWREFVNKEQALCRRAHKS